MQHHREVKKKVIVIIIYEFYLMNKYQLYGSARRNLVMKKCN